MTNAEHIRQMSDVELCGWLMKLNSDDREKIICKDKRTGCWIECKRDHFCEDKYYLCSEDIMMTWLKMEYEP